MESVLDLVRGSNDKLRGMLRLAGEALAGRGSFGVDELRAIAQRVGSMEPVVARAPELRQAVPELRGELEIYAQNLTDLNVAMDRVRCVLVARCASVEVQRGHLETVGLWAAAWQQTQPLDNV